MVLAIASIDDHRIIILAQSERPGHVQHSHTHPGGFEKGTGSIPRA